MSLNDGDLIAGTLDVLILKAVSWGPKHGYGIGRWISDSTGATLDVEEGALYPALHRLERRGWLESKWGKTELGRRAKFYGLTPKGRNQLTAQCERWHCYSRAVSLILNKSSA